MNKKMTLIAGAISSVLSGAALADINDVLITEYVESSVGNYATNSAIEITNFGDSDFTFTDQHTLFYSSYKNPVYLPDGSTNVLKDVVVPAGGSVVIVNSDAEQVVRDAVAANGASLVVAANYSEGRFNSLNFNGGEAVWIGETANADNVHDIIGENSDGWGKDITYRRAKDTLTPDSSFDAMHWASVGTDVYDDLGKPTLEDAPTPPTPPTEVTIAEVQGNGMFSPLIAEEHGDDLKEDAFYETTKNFKLTARVAHVLTSANNGVSKGFFLFDDDLDPETSNGLFVYSSKATDSMLGQEITVTGKVREYFGQTQFTLEKDGEWEIVTSSSIDIPAVELKRIPTDGESFSKTLERHEGMLVKLVEDMDDVKDGNQDMRVTRAFAFDFELYHKGVFRNNIALAYEEPNFHPNQKYVAGSLESLAKIEKNKDATLFLDSATAPSNGNIPYYPQFNADPNAYPIRINDGIKNVEGVITYSYDEYRLVPKADFVLKDTDIKANSPRTVANTDRRSPDYMLHNIDIEEGYGDDGFTIKVATQNVLNYFNSPYGGSSNAFGDNRGAESEEEFERQEAKIIEAIFSLNADVLGLMEIENNGFGDFGAMKQLLAKLNAKYDEEDYSKRNYSTSLHNRYVFVGFDANGDAVLDDQDTIGTDAITTGIIYRPSKVSLISGRVIPMPEQHAPMIVDDSGAAIIDDTGAIRESGDNYQRNTVVATFNVLNTGKQLTVAVNHLKSKGSTCYEDWVGWKSWENFDPVNDDVRNDDYQGSCENFRSAAAYQLGTQMAKLGGDQVLLGDMNSYAYEDPMLILTNIPSGKEIYASDYTFIDGLEFELSGERITKDFGYVNAVNLKTPEGKTAWSYSYNNEIGSLDHLLITPSLETRLVDAIDWHINAPESSLYDYSNYKKASDEVSNPFYEQSPFRSSDHDPAMVSLGYKYGESGEHPVTIAIKSGRAEIAFPVSDQAQAGDVAEISVSPRIDGLAMPSVTLSNPGAQTVMFDAVGLEAGEYTFTMTLKRATTARAAASTNIVESKVMRTDIIKRDSSNVKPVEPEYDGSGGSWGLGGLLTLLGLGFFRRRR